MKLEAFEPVSDLSIEARLEPYPQGFRLTFVVTGEGVSKVTLPERSEKPCRQDELWKATCFECFFSVGNSNQYFEFNGSPSGNWALYSFEGYRAGMKNHVFPKANEVPVMQSLVQEANQITCMWDLPRFTDAFLARAGVTAVIQTAAGVSYWAIRHAGEKPDFHLKGSFIHRLI